MNMKTLLSSVIILAGASSANAADIVKHHPRRIKQPTPVTQVVVMPPAPVFSWAGPYLGAEMGLVMTKFHGIDGDDDLASVVIKPKEQPSVGLFAGYNVAIGHHAILGLDGNIDYHSVESRSELQGYNKYKESALAAARVRLGFAQGCVLPYIAGGLSATRGALSLYNDNAIPASVNKQKAYIGWNIGGGVDYAVAHNVLLRLDYRFNNVKIKDLYLVDVANILQRVDANIATKSHEIRIGAAYKF
ncbi:outer membrane beta-barrel protein [Bartonella sp. TP]|uniref:outer membrane protein n=1 Tax=Bartonella sp. TP TaxID=3057550 RepID=UPI0025AF68E6|nr:outer membrane beta-barrel protein [Bartonella sp. TP]WJW80474.1 outer membrane beta-barrel protein [Bartonella sp. TP]